MGNNLKTSFQIPGLRWSLPSGGEIARFRFVSVNANSEAVQGGSVIVGASQNATVAGETQEIIDGIVQVEAAAAITAGTRVGTDANGMATAGGTIGIAITGATAAGELIAVKL